MTGCKLIPFQTCLPHYLNQCLTLRGEPILASTIIEEMTNIRLTADEFFKTVKADEKAWDISRQYEKRFGASNIIMKVLNNKLA